MGDSGIRVRDVRDLLAAGMSGEEILPDYPYLEFDDVRACLAYGAREVSHSILFTAA